MAGIADDASGFDVFYGDNVDFSGGFPPSAKVLLNGQLLIGSTALPHIRIGTITSSDASVTITNGAGTINLQAGSVVPTTFVEDAGSANPTANILNVKGSGSITTSGASNTITTQLTGLTNHNVLIGAGTTTITKVAPSATSGVPLISQGAAADPTFGTAAIAGGGTNATSFSTTNGITKFDGTRLVSSSTATLNSNNIYTNTAQPLVMAWLFNGVTNVTGDGTLYTMIYDQIEFTQGTEYNSGTGVFTAAVAGFYQVSFNVNVFPLTNVNTSMSVIVEGTGSAAREAIFNPFPIAIPTGATCFNWTSLIFLGAGQTLTPKVSVSGGAKNVGTTGAVAARAWNWFSVVRIT